MNKEQISVISRYIKENPDVSNSKLAEIIKEKSTKLGHLSKGSLQNYIGKVKKLDSKTIETSKGHAMDDIAESRQEKVSFEVNSSGSSKKHRAGLERIYKLCTGKSILPGFPFTMEVNKEDYESISKEIFGYGYDITAPVEVEESASDSTKTIVILQLDPSQALSIAKAMAPYVDIVENTMEFDSFVSSLKNISREHPAAFTFEEMKDSEEAFSKLSGFTGIVYGYAELVDDESEGNSEVVVSSDSPVFHNPHNTTDEDTVEEEEVVLPVHYDLLVVGAVDDTLKADYKGFLEKVSSTSCKQKVFVYGDEAREADFVGNRINMNSKTIGQTNKIGRGVKEAYALYDGINAAIGYALANVLDPVNTDVSITIITSRGVDYGSTFTSREYIAELIHKVKSRFGWSINIMVKDRPAQDVAVELGIDSSNSMDYTYSYDVPRKLGEARERRNDLIYQGCTSPINFF